MSLRKTPRCATCRKTEDEVSIKACSRCGVITYCSELCENANAKKHELHCQILTGSGDEDDKTEAILAIAILHDNYQALGRVVERIERPGFRPKWKKPFDDLDLACFHMELGKPFINSIDCF